MCNSDLQRKVRSNLSVAVCFRVGLTRISSQLPVSDLGEWRHICHFFRWQTMWRVTFVTFLGRMWRSRARKCLFNLWRFLSHPSQKTSHFGPAGTKNFETGRNVTIRLGLKHSYLFPSQICHLSRKREAGRPFGLRPTLSVFQCVECVAVCYNVNISRAASTAFDQISLRGSIQCVCCSVL